VVEEDLEGELKMRDDGKQIARLRRICLSLPETEERLSHGEPTFFVRKKVFCAFSNNHHNDGHIAACIPAAPGRQAEMIEEAPETFYRPPYVGVKGWVGVEMARIGDAELAELIRAAWRLVAPKKLSVNTA
jgi:hypothetical protein